MENSIGMRLVRIPAGGFDMGSHARELAPTFPGMPPMRMESNENPLHRVRITRSFFIGVTPVTQGQWGKVFPGSWSATWSDCGCLYENVIEGENVAADYVTWQEAIEFCDAPTRRERLTGRLLPEQRYRLPTEAEWEYACRAGSTTAFTYGESDDRLGEYAWYSKNADDIGEAHAHEVGLKKPNEWGLHDMHGNVEEWCSDWYADDYYASSPSVDPTGPTDGKCRVLRGGSWSKVSFYCRSASRGLFLPDVKPDHGGYGFGAVCDVAEA